MAPTCPTSKTAQNAIAALPGATQAKISAALPEAKQAKLDSVSAMLDGLMKQEMKKVISKANKLAKSEGVQRRSWLLLSYDLLSFQRPNQLIFRQTDGFKFSPL